jgi:hypothetical protein
MRPNVFAGRSWRFSRIKDATKSAATGETLEGQVAAFLARNNGHGRRFECAGTADPHAMLEWLTSVCAIPAQMGNPLKCGGRRFVVGRKRVDYAGLIAIVDAQRLKRGLQPFRPQARIEARAAA